MEYSPDASLEVLHENAGTGPRNGIETGLYCPNGKPRNDRGFFTLRGKPLDS